MPPEPPYDEKDLLQRIAAGNEAAFNGMVDRYAGKIYQVALAYIKIPESAEDVTQEVFYKIWKTREKLRQVDSLKDYLFIIARNEVLSALRRKGPRFPVSPYLESSLEEKDLLPAQTLALRQLQQIARSAVRLLPPQQQQAYRLSREEGLSHEEIALQMQISRHTVKNHIVAALNFIRHYIRTHGELLVMLFSFFF